MSQKKSGKDESDSEKDEGDDDEESIDLGEDFMDDFQDSDLEEIQVGGTEPGFDEEDVAFSDNGNH